MVGERMDESVRTIQGRPAVEVSPAQAGSMVGRAQALIAQIENLQRLEEQEAERDSYVDVGGDLRAARARLAPIPGRLNLFAARDIDVSVNQGNVRALRQRLHRVRQEYERGPSSILEAKRDLRDEFWSRLKSVPSEIESAVTRAWRNYVESNLPAEPMRRLEILDRVPILQNKIAVVRQQFREARELLARTPGSNSDFEAVGTVAARINLALRNLYGSGISDEVMRFIESATTERGADPNQLTDPVKQGLEQLGLHRLLRVRLGT